MDILEIKSIDSIDVDAIIKELSGNIVTTKDEGEDHFSKYDANNNLVYSYFRGVEQWKGKLDDGTVVYIVFTNDKLTRISLMKKGRREKYEYSNGYEVWDIRDEKGSAVYYKGKNGGKVTEHKYDPDIGKTLSSVVRLNGEIIKSEKWEYAKFSINGEIQPRLKNHVKEEKGKIVEESERKYDSEGRVIYFYENIENNKTIHRYEYDDSDNGQGKLSKETIEQNDGRIVEKITKYGDDGEVAYEAKITDGVIETETRITRSGDVTHIHFKSEEEETWIDRDVIGVINKKQRVKRLDDFRYFEDIIDVEKAPIRTVVKDRVIFRL